jgi:hypothetical protein
MKELKLRAWAPLFLVSDKLSLTPLDEVEQDMGYHRTESTARRNRSPQDLTSLDRSGSASNCRRTFVSG